MTLTEVKPAPKRQTVIANCRECKRLRDKVYYEKRMGRT